MLKVFRVLSGSRTAWKVLAGRGMGFPRAITGDQAKVVSPVATMIPELDPASIHNSGEREFYLAARELPREYTVCYSYRFMTPGSSGEELREADFVIAHPALGYLVVEVKGGDVLCEGGRWFRLLEDGSREPLNKDPTAQAQKAMYAILHRYQDLSGNSWFPLEIRYAVSFPHCCRMKGGLPADLNPTRVLLYPDLDNLETRLQQVFAVQIRRYEPRATDFLVNQVLAPTFQVFARLEDRIGMFHRAAERLLTEEQERILEETELDRRKVFLGPAGTGKTFLAMEKARRLSDEGKSVLITCFNRALGHFFRRELPEEIEAANFHDFLLQRLSQAGIHLQVPAGAQEQGEFFRATLPDAGFDYFMSLPPEKKLDSLIVDEGQDFREEWFSCLESMVREEGEFYIFADPHQALFSDWKDLQGTLEVSRQRLTRNLRNAATINQWLNQSFPGLNLKSQIQGGVPVSLFPWSTLEDERRLMARETGRLVSQGIQPGRILLLSPNKKDKGCLAQEEKLKTWPIITSLEEKDPQCLRFATIRSFKGLEADIVFLFGIRPDTLACTEADIYVGGSRARFLLNIFHHEEAKL